LNINIVLKIDKVNCILKLYVRTTIIVLKRCSTNYCNFRL